MSLHWRVDLLLAVAIIALGIAGSPQDRGTDLHPCAIAAAEWAAGSKDSAAESGGERVLCSTCR